MCKARALLLSAAAVFLAYQLFLPPVVALADNGDFAKVIGRFGLVARVHRVYEFADTTYEFHPERRWKSRFTSSEVPLAHAAVFLNSLLSKDGAFDIRMIGAVHALLFLAALWLAAPLLNRAVALAALLFFCDAVYASGLNSFYMDEAAYLFLLLAAVFYLRALTSRDWRDTAGFLICALAVAASKPQHALLGLGFAALTPILLRPRPAVVAAAALTAASLLMLWKGAPKGYAANSVYDVVFVQLLPHSRNVPETLRALHLDASYVPLMGKNAYWGDSRMDDPSFNREFQRRISFPKLAVFYVTHPRDTWTALAASLDEAARPMDCGTFDAAAGYPPMAESRAFTTWSGFKRRVFLGHGVRLLGTFIGIAAIFLTLLVRLRKRLPQGSLAGGAALVAMAIIELIVSSLGDAMDIARHHTIFFALFDLMALSVVALAIQSCTSALDSRPVFSFGLRHRAPTRAAD
jgi:hypothetical protein